MNRIKVLALLLAIVMLTGCEFIISSFNWDDYKYGFEEDFEKSAEGITALELGILNGSVTVSSVDTNTISIELEERIKATDEERAKEIADSVDLKLDRRGDTLVIGLEYEDERLFKRHYAAKIQITLPATIALNLSSTNGTLAAKWMSAGVKAHTTNGSVVVEKCEGEIILETTNGSVKALDATGPVSADTTNGSITITGQAPVRASSTNGGVNVSITSELNGDVSISTTNGGVSLTMLSGSSFRLDAETNNGSISNDFPGSFETNKRRTEMSGNTPGAKHQVKLRTSNGGIKIRQGN